MMKKSDITDTEDNGGILSAKKVQNFGEIIVNTVRLLFYRYFLFTMSEVAFSLVAGFVMKQCAATEKWFADIVYIALFAVYVIFTVVHIYISRFFTLPKPYQFLIINIFGIYLSVLSIYTFAEITGSDFASTAQLVNCLPSYVFSGIAERDYSHFVYLFQIFVTFASAFIFGLLYKKRLSPKEEQALEYARDIEAEEREMLKHQISKNVAASERIRRVGEVKDTSDGISEKNEENIERIKEIHSEKNTAADRFGYSSKVSSKTADGNFAEHVSNTVKNGKGKSVNDYGNSYESRFNGSYEADDGNDYGYYGNDGDIDFDELLTFEENNLKNEAETDSKGRTVEGDYLIIPGINNIEKNEEGECVYIPLGLGKKNGERANVGKREMQGTAKNPTTSSMREGHVYLNRKYAHMPTKAEKSEDRRENPENTAFDIAGNNRNYGYNSTGQKSDGQPEYVSPYEKGSSNARISPQSNTERQKREFVNTEKRGKDVKIGDEINTANVNSENIRRDIFTYTPGAKKSGMGRNAARHGGKNNRAYFETSDLFDVSGTAAESVEKSVNRDRSDGSGRIDGIDYADNGNREYERKVMQNNDGSVSDDLS